MVFDKKAWMRVCMRAYRRRRRRKPPPGYFDKKAWSRPYMREYMRKVRARQKLERERDEAVNTAMARLSNRAPAADLSVNDRLARSETNLRKERQLKGIAKAKAEGVYKGRQASIDPVQVREMKAQGMGRHRHRQGSQHPPRERLSGVGGGARMMGHRERLIDGDEYDALTAAGKRVHRWRAGQRTSAKRSVSRRARQEGESADYRNGGRSCES
jgi:hypothetical protein